MCGICGIVSLDGMLAPAIRDALPAMTDALRHRGPDGRGFFSDEWAALGHRRLAIIDREGGHQPMTNEDATVWVVFNGEIYNHADLRRELTARGHTFRTTSDTEVIVHAYEEYGRECVGRFEGMFAFGVYDVRQRQLLLARDRIGKKPLFYASLGGALHFASEMKALFHSPSWDDALDWSGLETYLTLGYLLAPSTIYRHVKKLEPGCWLLARNGVIQTGRYWAIDQFDTDERSEALVIEELEEILGLAVKDRLESEVPLGAFLSGGIDSGLVVSFMAQAMPDPVVTTSVGFGEAAHNELSAAALTAAKYSTRHYPEMIEPDVLAVLDPIVAAFDEPFADSSAIPTYYVSEVARRHVTVALSGDGGDECFTGYDSRYVPHALEARARALVPGEAGRRGLRWLSAHWPRSTRLPKVLRLSTILDNVTRDPAAAYFADNCFLAPAHARALLGRPTSDGALDSPAFEQFTEPYRRCSSPSPVQRAQYADLNAYLPNDVLVKVDRMSMAHSLEIRCPLLDRRVVEFAFRVPTSRKFPRLRAKHLLRQLARRRLPRQIAEAPKHGFTAPVGTWMSDHYKDAFFADVFGSASHVATMLDTAAIRRMWQEHRDCVVDHAFGLWAIWVLERWSRLYQEGRQRRVTAASVGPSERVADAAQADRGRLVPGVMLHHPLPE